MKKLLSFSIALLLMGCSCPDLIERQFLGCTLGESTEADIIAAMVEYEISLSRQGSYISYSHVPFGGFVWESVSFVIENDTVEGMIFSDESKLPFVRQVERFDKKYSKYCKTEGKDDLEEWHDYSDGKTQIEIWYSDLLPGTLLIYRDSSSKSWQEW